MRIVSIFMHANIRASSLLSRCLSRFFYMAHNHLFSNHCLCRCDMPVFQSEMRTCGEGFLCQLGIGSGNPPQSSIGRLESEIVSPLGPCPPPLPDSHQSHADNQTNGFLALAYPAFHCLGGRPRGSLLRASGMCGYQKNRHECL